MYDESKKYTFTEISPIGLHIRENLPPFGNEDRILIM